MSERLRKFVQRSPRYTLRTQDRMSMRFSLEHTLGAGGIEQTLLLNLSETGVAFLVHAGFEPRIGERVKVEIPIPGGEQIAWWATVVRTSEYESFNWFNRKNSVDLTNKVFVALRFEDLPEGHSRTLREGLRQSFLQALRDQKYRDWIYYRQNLAQLATRILIYSVITALAFGFIYWFSQPDQKYDAKRGAPWGERFKF